ncbi:phage shock protein C [Halioglobus japonicus]|uniref:PspC domain-containing protein n=1 Tax=Halioglobus japonicus TaxID=930805 RepID=A0AAP8MHC0_9GAMM|nr:MULTISPECIES: PspC domain-containing protein [Halioglobus]AQA19050.1 phage shock protein C [Halioglobus japonicus]KZX56572.1 phage shock protein C [Halioglobus sp. HI00S01]PLW87926.1 PspC domain-containing protein [Halioglobus japonicus]GHD20122.1 phage-shock protein [Halioglobus japonicus]
MSRRYDDRRGGRGHHARKFYSNKRGGWGMGLYRNTRDGKVAGVCAGLADHWDIAHWVMRMIWIGGFIFTGTLALWIYLAAWVLLSPRPTRRSNDSYSWQEPDYDEVEVEMEYDERYHDYRPRKVFRYSESSSVRLNRARERLDAALRRVEDMESYVTSRKFKLNREFSNL